eukprot:snap_masked-scaffold_3-processed-gene-20.18-mRNA-1 protein AED:0.19 eAED:1.00 QI:0/-1/0/1/-1/1/1/0/374
MEITYLVVQYVIVFLALLDFTYASQCYDSCFVSSFNNCNEDRVCVDRCGQSLSGAQNNFPQAFPGFVVDECENECLWGEFNFTRSNANFFTIALPFGCKENYFPERISNNILSNIQFSDGVNLFSCEGDFCNQPPEQTDCGEEEAIEYTQNFDNLSPCFTNNSEFTPLRSNPFRVVIGSGLVKVNVSHLNKCVELTASEIQTLSFKRFNSQNINQELSFITCDECRGTPGCDINTDEFEAEVISEVPDDETSAPTTEDNKDGKNEQVIIIPILVVLVTLLSLIILLMSYRRKREKEDLMTLGNAPVAQAEVVSEPDKHVPALPVAMQMGIWSVEAGNGQDVLEELENMEEVDEDRRQRQKVDVEKDLDVDLDFH